MDSIFRQNPALGQGCFGKVYKGKYQEQTAAIKVVPDHKLDENQLDRECRAFGQLNHKNIVKLLGEPEKRGDKWYFPLEYISGSTLEDLMFKNGALTDKANVIIIHGMCDGLNYIHMKNIVHQDLKPDNIMDS
uniref:Probable serine/threonine-protein kinase DDB_G0284251 isoform X2 n=1 Tax=Geotrypetes seraphini TaxID=260995 RepID=A0A6P8SMG8_GEOSA|nr:probable serine/threonine-protein kinase DDB_G0284251 isoform X2 [Geotrypetes seraphini]